jgi:hypothetical protein
MVCAVFTLGAMPTFAGDCLTGCEGQGNATLLMRGITDVGADLKFRFGGAPSGAYILYRDFGAGPTDVPGLGTVCLDFGPDLAEVATGSLSARGFAAVLTEIPDDPGLVGQLVAFQLVVEDPVAPNGFAISNGISFELHPEGTGNRTCEPCDLEGCTPGYWKNHEESWVETGFLPGDLVSSVFTLPECLGGCDPLFESLTLIEALDLGGGPAVCGGARNLLRPAVAALLNASDPFVAYPRTVSEVILAVDAALAGCDRNEMLGLGSELDEDNNLGCPLNGGNGSAGSGIRGIVEECESGFTKIGFVFPSFYEGDLPAEISVLVANAAMPEDVIGEVSFAYDPNNPPVFPIQSGGLCVRKVSVHEDVVVIFATADATSYGEGRFPLTTLLRTTVGTVVNERVIDTSCETPVDVGTKFVPVFVTSVEVLD